MFPFSIEKGSYSFCSSFKCFLKKFLFRYSPVICRLINKCSFQQIPFQQIKLFNTSYISIKPCFSPLECKTWKSAIKNWNMAIFRFTTSKAGPLTQQHSNSSSIICEWGFWLNRWNLYVGYCIFGGLFSKSNSISSALRRIVSCLNGNQTFRLKIIIFRSKVI